MQYPTLLTAFPWSEFSEWNKSAGFSIIRRYVPLDENLANHLYGDCLPASWPISFFSTAIRARYFYLAPAAFADSRARATMYAWIDFTCPASRIFWNDGMPAEARLPPSTMSSIPSRVSLFA